MPRRETTETPFGSDSFLDIVANIVGILIILIVVAGVRVSRAPLLSIDEKPVPEATEKTITLWANESFADDDDAILVDLEAEPVPVVVVEEPVIIEPFVAPPEEQFPEIMEATPPQKLVAEVESLESQLEEMSLRIETAQTEKDRAVKTVAESREAIESIDKEQEEVSERLEQQRLQEALISLENEESQDLLHRLQERLDEVTSQEPETNQLSHRLNPVGRIVSGREVHFRLEGGEVSFVPVDQLSQLVKQQMQRRKDFLLRQPRFQATVGPVDGYSMEFLVQRDSDGLMNSSRFGSGIVKVRVTDWIIQPGRNIRGETVEQALTSGSEFRRALLSQGTTATVTFWVYPDSYDTHRQLKDFLHEAGFWVASRPLPTGFPIAGSSSGSKSVAQ